LPLANRVAIRLTAAAVDINPLAHDFCSLAAQLKRFLKATCSAIARASTLLALATGSTHGPKSRERSEAGDLDRTV
jgi:hypothetical protein